ncbi:MAG: DUF1538 domain-containing protein [Gammaproteobacteria bacterium]|nr:DUF1538 domain-containing protein [Gammaproteobacteria bacterium]MDH3464339.1 DUF1538 domain-containing protein [Gammaproteobacteria bacterium]
MRVLFQPLLSSARDLAPIIIIIAFFQIVILQQPMPNVLDLLTGVICVMFGLALFLYGLELGLFPVGESMAYAFAKKGSTVWLLAFAFALGFGTTVAEPALIAVADEASTVAAQSGLIVESDTAREKFALQLRLTVAISVGLAILVGVIRILKGWPLHLMIMVGYGLVVALTALAPREIIGIAYDSGGVTTSTITVPLVTALGIGLARSIRGRNPMIDGFGLIAFASLFPMLFVMLYGLFLS